MIVGVDHLSYNSKNKNYFKKKIFNYKKIYEYKKVNHAQKKKFLKKNVNYHFISFYKNLYIYPSIEKTYYTKTALKAENINFKKNKIYFKIKSLKEELIFWKKNFKLKIKNNKINFFSIYDQKNYKLYFSETLKKNDYLDYYGYTSICFISTDVSKIFKKFKTFGLEITKIFKLEINKKKIKVFFCRTPGGIIVEIIEYL